MNFCSRFLRLSVVPRCRERPQIAMCFLEWLGRLKWRATGLDASLSFFSTSRRCSRNRSPSRLPVSRSYLVEASGSILRRNRSALQPYADESLSSDEKPSTSDDKPFHQQTSCARTSRYTGGLCHTHAFGTTDKASPKT